MLEHVVGASHRQPDTVIVVLECVVGHNGVETFHHRQSGVGVIVDIVACEDQRSTEKGRASTKTPCALRR